jgi:ribosome-associated heat shock protein Hsp15
VETTRVDRLLWAIRIYKTRSLATAACRAGHVKIDGTTVKASHPVGVRDRLRVTVGDEVRDLEITEIITRRVGASVAATCFVDHTPPRVATEQSDGPFLRDRAAGRPTKRDRRQLDRLRGM